MTRILYIFFCLLLAACSANEAKETVDTVLEAPKEQSLNQNDEVETEIIAAPPKPTDSPAPKESITVYPLTEPEYVYEDRPLPSLKPLSKLDEILPNVTLTQVNHKPSDIKITSPEDACQIERAPKLPMPSALKFSHTSPDKTNALYVDEGFLGGDHDVFDNLSAIIDGKGHQAMIVTPIESILVTVKTDYGIGLNYSQGKVSCSLSRTVMNPIYYGFTTYYTHNTDLEGKTETLSLRGRKRDECLTLIDKDNTEFVAIFPNLYKIAYATDL